MLLHRLLQNTVVVRIYFDEILNAYTEPDAYAENKHPSRPRSGSSNTIGKNDLWIAATALVTDAALLTANKDFQLFDPDFLSVRVLQPT